MRTIFIWLLLVSQSFAELDVSVTKSRVLSGLANPRVVGDVVLIDGDQQPKVTPAAIVTVKTDYKFVRVKARTSLFEALPIEKLSDGSYLLTGPGKFALEVTVFDPEKGIDEKVVVVELGEITPPTPPDPPKPPEPKPEPVKPDLFDNIGQRVAQATATATKKLEVAKVYREGAVSLREDPSVTVNDVFEKVFQKRATIVGVDPAWKPFSELLQADVQKRWPMSRGVVADYFDAVSAGLDPAKAASSVCEREDCQCNAGGTPCPCVSCKCGSK